MSTSSDLLAAPLSFLCRRIRIPRQSSSEAANYRCYSTGSNSKAVVVGPGTSDRLYRPELAVKRGCFGPSS